MGDSLSYLDNLLIKLILESQNSPTFPFFEYPFAHYRDTNTTKTLLVVQTLEGGAF